MNMQTSDLIPALKNSFDSCETLEGSIVRCEHRFNGRLRSVFFVKASEEVPEKNDVEEIQKSVVAPSYFASRDESRWNHYLVFVVPTSATPKDAMRRAQIEKDTSYARKLVVPYSELDAFLRRGANRDINGTSNANALQQAWSDVLQEAGLDAVDSSESRSSVIRAIRAGTKISGDRSRRAVVDTQPLTFLAELRIREFGARSLKGNFTFGRINLIRGLNGAGKTSLLEAIEHFLCGGTARGKTPEKLDAIATFTGSDREISFQQRPISYYQQRDLKWYGRKITQRNRLYEGFARYNFLSADAAVDFSREEDQHDLTTLLSRVALGPEAGFTWDRIQQFYGDIGPQLGTLHREIATLEGHLDKVNARLVALAVPAPELSTRSEHTAGLFAKLGLDISPDALTTSAGFQSIAGFRALLDSVPDDFPETLELVQRELTQVENALERIRSIEVAQRANEAKRVELDASLKSVESLGRCVDRIREYVQVKFSEFANRIAEMNRYEPVALPGRDVMSRLRSEVDKLAKGKGGEVSLRERAGLLKGEIAKIRRELDEANTSLEVKTSKENERQILSAQLRSIGLQLARNHPNDGCPLCHTNMSVDSLLERIQEVIVDEDSEQISVMQEVRNRLLSHLSTLLDTQGLIDSVLRGFPVTSEASIQDVFAMIDEAEEAEARNSAERSELLATMSKLQADGFSLQELLGLMARCEAEFKPYFGSFPIPQDTLQRADENISTRRATVLQEVARCDEAEKKLMAALREQSVSMCGHPDVADVKLSAARRTATLRKFIGAFGDLDTEVQARASTGLTAFIDLAQVAYSQVSALSEELRDSQSRNAEIVSLKEEAQSLRRSLSSLRDESRNLKSAHSALDRIINEHSLERGLTDFLSSNLLSIQSIFQRIHVPNELRLSNLSACELVRIADGSRTSLSQISTGQRAALVLSVFLTLNMSLRSGPPMMLVDDPIAHVDDMNSLALLDYLADVAETGQRQVFFATADEKLANLFEKKMAFMGSQFKVIPLERGIPGGERGH